jgi:hypothetical protein
MKKIKYKVVQWFGWFGWLGWFWVVLGVVVCLSGGVIVV